MPWRRLGGYLHFFNGKGTVGYGSVWGKDDRKARDTIFEFYLLRSYRKFANIIFPKFRIISGADFLECQTNNKLQSEIMFEYAETSMRKQYFLKIAFRLN
jgi:hypothetical protein